MADVDLTVLTLDAADGDAVSYQAMAIADSYFYVNTGVELILLENSTGGSAVLTITVTEDIEGDLVVPDRTVTIANNETRIIPPRNTAYYNDSAGKVQLDCDTALVNVVVFKN